MRLAQIDVSSHTSSVRASNRRTFQACLHQTRSLNGLSQCKWLLTQFNVVRPALKVTGYINDFIESQCWQTRMCLLKTGLTVYLYTLLTYMFQMLAFSVLDSSLTFDRQQQWLSYMTSKGYIDHLVKSLLQDDEQLQGMLSQQPEPFKALYRYESKMVSCSALNEHHVLYPRASMRRAFPAKSG